MTTTNQSNEISTSAAKQISDGDLNTSTEKKNVRINQPSIIVAKKSKRTIAQNSSWMNITR
jgi:hypothetical protein